MKIRRMWGNVSLPAVSAIVAGFGLTYLLVGNVRYGGSIIAVLGSLASLASGFVLQLRAIRCKHATELSLACAERDVARQGLACHEVAIRGAAFHAMRLHDQAVASSANAISMYDAAGPDFKLLYVNSAFERMSGFASAEILGKPIWSVHQDIGKAAPTGLSGALAAGREATFVQRSQRRDGTLYWSELHLAPVMDASRVVTYYVLAQTDITALRSYQEQLEQRANYDSLTGVANRVLLLERLSIALQFGVRYQRPVWVLFIGLDRFKAINETAGHAAGDAVLKSLATRLSVCAGITDTVSRFGGDEFVVVLQEPQDEHAALRIVDAIRASIAQPISVGAASYFVGSSIGIATWPGDSRDAETLIMRADSAMHGAKANGSGNLQFYTPQMNQRALVRTHLESEMREALQGNQFVLHYQPQVDMRSGRIVGMEALIRWRHPERGQISPAEFIGLAEETGLIIPIGAWVISTACAQLKQWQRCGYENLRMAVNLSARQFNDDDLVASIASMLRAAEIDASQLQLELTESLVMADVERGIGVLRELRALGVSVAVDDFGTGYSSLAYLKRLPIDTLKIDRSFVSDITLNPDDAVIVASIISLAHSLRLHVVAEGVETQEQLAFLQASGCDELQGYFFCRPVAAADFTRLLEQGKSLPAYQEAATPAPRLVRI